MQRNDRIIDKLKGDFVLRRELSKFAISTSGLRTIYVDSATGVDAITRSGTVNDPFQTLYYVWNSVLPYMINHAIQIEIFVGTHNLTASYAALSAKIGKGSIIISGGNSNPAITVLDGLGLYTRILDFTNVRVPVTLRYVTINDATSAGIYASNSLLTITSAVIQNNGLYGLQVANKATVDISNSTVASNGTGIRAESDSYVSSNTVSGANTTYGLQAVSFGKILKTSTQPTGGTNENTATGGAIS